MIILGKQTAEGESAHYDRDALLSDINFVTELVGQLVYGGWKIEDINSFLPNHVPSTIAKAELQEYQEDILRLFIEPNSGLDKIDIVMTIQRENKQD